jgi:hypothetical protein
VPISFVASRENIMIFAAHWRRQARVCARLAEDCEDQYLAERLKHMAADLAAKADEVEELPSERVNPPLAA